jgi:hypothetical protein
MARRKGYNPGATHGWEGEARQEDLDGRIQHEVNNQGPREYKETYRSAVDMLNKLATPDDVRKALHRDPDRIAYADTDTSTIYDDKKGSNAVEEQLCKIRDKAIEDAIAGKPESPP